MDNKKIILGIPTINRSDLLKESLEDISKNLNNLERYIIIDNGNQNINVPENLRNSVIIHKPGKNLGVAASWNLIMKIAFEYLNSDYVLLLNDDIVLGHGRKKIEDVIQEYKDFYVLVGGHSWSIIIISKEAYDKVGKFDEKFYPAYFEDNDYRQRIKKFEGGDVKKFFSVNGFIPKIKRTSMTIKKDSKINKEFSKNKEYYIKKWGGLPRHEIFKTPFGK